MVTKRSKSFDKTDGWCVCFGSVYLYQDSNGDLAVSNTTNTAALDMSARNGNNITVA